MLTTLLIPTDVEKRHIYYITQTKKAQKPS